jgi:hypothetical protein
MTSSIRSTLPLAENSMRISIIGSSNRRLLTNTQNTRAIRARRTFCGGISRTRIDCELPLAIPRPQPRLAGSRDMSSIKAIRPRCWQKATRWPSAVSQSCERCKCDCGTCTKPGAFLRRRRLNSYECNLFGGDLAGLSSGYIFSSNKSAGQDFRFQRIANCANQSFRRAVTKSRGLSVSAIFGSGDRSGSVFRRRNGRIAQDPSNSDADNCSRDSIDSTQAAEVSAGRSCAH